MGQHVGDLKIWMVRVVKSHIVEFKRVEMLMRIL